jgi:glycosyltransferase involved in cell wall biosynthesis
VTLRLDYLSPLPPVRSGISDYSVDLLPHLAAAADVRVVRVPEQPVDDAVEARWHPVAIARLGEDGRLPLYQMGNNQYHEEVRRAALRLPGVMTLHDVVLHHQLLGRTVGKDDHPSYVAALEADHGPAGRAVARSAYWGGIGHAAQFELPAHRSLVRSQRGILVHSAWAAEVIAEEHEGVEVRVVPMPIPLPAPAEASRGFVFRERHRLPPTAPLIGSFGFQTPIKRTEHAVRALAERGLEGVHLLVAGELSPHVEIVETARELGVADRVHVLGYLPYEEFEAGIAACDLCLNLRYPSAGETSASLLRVLAMGRPVIVSDHAQFAEMPGEIALRVPLGEGEVESLAGALRDLLAEPGRLREMGSRASEYVARAHDPAASARRIAEACAELAALRPPAPLPLGAEPDTTMIVRRFAGEVRVEGAEPPWNAGERRRLRVVLRNRGEARWLAGERGLGGVAVELRVRDGRGRDVSPADGWRALPRDLGPGESWSFEVDVRRPADGGSLRVEPRIVGREGFSYFGGPLWESVI